MVLFCSRVFRHLPTLAPLLGALSLFAPAPAEAHPTPPPTNLQALAGNAQVTLTWSGVHPFDSYTVEYGEHPNGPFSTRKIPHTANRSVTITGLTNNTTYQFRVRTRFPGHLTGLWTPFVTATPTDDDRAGGVDETTPPVDPNPPSDDGGGAAVSSDASLAGLAVAAGADGTDFGETPALTPAFDADTSDYAAAVSFSATRVRLTPAAGHGDAAVKIGPRGGELTETASGEPGPAFALAVGANVFEVEVTAGDGETTETYTVTVTRARPPLASLTLRAGGGENFDETPALTPAFDPATADYAAAVSFSATRARLIPELAREDAAVKIGPRGGALSDAADGEPGPVFDLAAGGNVFEIVVTAAGGAAATYTVTVTRPAPPVPLDAAAAREHLFPLLVDGGGFRVRLFLTNVSAYPRNPCTLELRGAGLGAARFGDHPALTVSGGELSIDSGASSAGVALTTGGAGELAFGYGKLTCAEPAAARLLLLRESGGVPAALANQESARTARTHRFTLPARLGRPGLALANDGDAAAACAVEVETAAGDSAGGGNIAAPARSAVNAKVKTANSAKVKVPSSRCR